MDDQDNIEELAVLWVKQNYKAIIERFANLKDFPSVTNPFTMFMAGSPGAGKTEFSKTFIEDYPDKITKIVRIDADQIRDMIPYYKGCNAYKVQGGAGLGVQKLFDYVQDHDQNVIVDGTFSDFDKSLENVQRALKHNRKIGIFYLYQDPLIAWDFTKEREVKEGRHVSKDMFIESFFKAKENVNRVKEMLGNQIELYLAEKDYLNDMKKPYFNINKVDDHLKIGYNKEDLERELQ